LLKIKAHNGQNLSGTVRIYVLSLDTKRVRLKFFVSCHQQ